MSRMSQKRKHDEDENNQESISLQDVIEEDQEMEETADAVLGASDDQECTFTKGYLGRQALYACDTCSSIDDSPGGICLACSLECHNGHDLYELYTKRHFRCDCGNDKFPELKCKLIPDKDPNNPENIYSQNFNGLYCTCKRPYPDEEDDVEDEMIQCVVCEDWFHGRHLGEASISTNMGFSEMICFDCSKSCTFLHKYSALLVSPVKLEKCFEEGDVDVTDMKASPVKSDGAAAIACMPMKEENIKTDSGDVANGSGSTSNDSSFCKIEGAIPVKIIGATFWPAGWRAVLCKCNKCMDIYNDFKVLFLLDENDTVSSYEEEGRKKALANKYEKQENALKGMSRVHQVEMLHGYNDMKEGLTQYLRKFAEEGKVVTATDIQNFFSGLNNKRQKLDMSYNCR
ncbi:unnamed protein product [Clavelina lepadiformis]|uniref:UBR-type domain-containing protein n=1 Tax=Clavelina lepadiformis TaxID=159417 RepID=A0ABP0H1T4_CLALP